MSPTVEKILEVILSLLAAAIAGFVISYDLSKRADEANATRLGAKALRMQAARFALTMAIVVAFWWIGYFVF
jgi:hypothetical protein